MRAERTFARATHRSGRIALLSAATLLVVATLIFVWSHRSRAPARISLSTDRLDFGAVEPGETATGAVEISNTGGSPLQILAVKTSCGCTAAVPAETLLQPGQQTSLSIRFAPGSSITASAVINVATNAPESPNRGIRVTSHRAERVFVSPSRIVIDADRDVSPADGQTDAVIYWTTAFPKLPDGNTIQAKLNFSGADTAIELDHGQNRATIRVVPLPELPVGITLGKLRLFDATGAVNKTVGIEIHKAGGTFVPISRVVHPLRTGPRSIAVKFRNSPPDVSAVNEMNAVAAGEGDVPFDLTVSPTSDGVDITMLAKSTSSGMGTAPRSQPWHGHVLLRWRDSTGFEVFSIPVLSIPTAAPVN